MTVERVIQRWPPQKVSKHPNLTQAGISVLWLGLFSDKCPSQISGQSAWRCPNWSVLLARRLCCSGRGWADPGGCPIAAWRSGSFCGATASCWLGEHSLLPILGLFLQGSSCPHSWPPSLLPVPGRSSWFPWPDCVTSGAPVFLEGAPSRTGRMPRGFADGAVLFHCSCLCPPALGALVGDGL